MKLEEYLNAVTEQIRCKKAREPVSNELRDHIMDQAAAYEADGMFEEEALEKAVRDMGDPVETGVSLDRVHRPRMSVDILLLAGIIGLFSIAVHAALSGCRSEYTVSGITYLQNHIVYTMLGCLLMLAVYCLDYSILSRWGRQIAGAFLAFIFVSYYFFGITVNGATRWIRLGPLSISLLMLLYLFVPLYGGVLYVYRGQGYKGIGKSLLWAIVPAFFAWYMSSMVGAMILFSASVILLSIAVWRNWYEVNRKKVLACLWAGILLMPVLVLGFLYATNSLEGYQMQRIRWFLEQNGEYNYQQLTAKAFLGSSHLIGKNADNVAELAQKLPDFNSDYVFVSLVSAYGILAGALVCALLILLVVKIFRISMKQRNQLGMILGCGCGIVFLFQILMSLAVNLNLLPNTSVSLPFFSAGGSGIVVSYILLGIVLSVYRYKDILTEKSIPKKPTGAMPQES